MKEFSVKNYQMPGLWAIKDHNSCLIDLSPELANLVGWKHPDEGRGKTDYDVPCESAEFAPEFIKADQKALELDQRTVCVDIISYQNNWKIILMERNIVALEDENKGVSSFGLDVTNFQQFQSFWFLKKHDEIFMNEKSKPISYSLSSYNGPLLKLTKRQEMVVFFLMRGKSAKEIARILINEKTGEFTKRRTIEAHIENIKIALDCPNKRAITEKAIEAGFLYCIPERIKKIGLEKVF